MVFTCGTFCFIPINLSFIQVRAINNFRLEGNWSGAVCVNIPLPTIKAPTTEEPTPTDIGVPPWAYAVIALAIVIPAILLTVAGVCASCHYCCGSVKTVSNVSR